MIFITIIIILLCVIYFYPRGESLVIERSDRINKELVEQNPHWLFIFEDTDARKHPLRYYRNTLGIPTKKNPDKTVKSYYSDEDYKINMYKINSAIIDLKAKLGSGGYQKIIIANFLGLKYAPKTRRFLESILETI
jgi:hypothetical protein